MLLDPKPKSKEADLFSRGEELKELLSSLRDNPITLITGIRRVGKSSLMRVAIAETEQDSIMIDVRRIYSDSSGSMGRADLSYAIQGELEKKLKKERIKALLSKVKGVSFMGNSVTFDWNDITLSSLLEKLNDHPKPFIIAFDEAQYFRYYGGKGGKSIQNLIAWAFDNLQNIRFLLTGSEVGLIHDFIGTDDYESPLHGRYMYEIVLKPFSKDISIEFLKAAFAESDMQIPVEEITAAQNLLDGIVGHLVQYGLNRLRRSHDEALSETFRTAKMLFISELKELEKRSPRYRKVLEFIASGATTFTAILRSFQASGDSASKSRVADALRILERSSWINKEHGKYSIIDCVLAELIKNGGF
ncbi:ATP-binding protein [Mesotoga prima]|uniref:AAA family ATPase n=1 Tax=Mesotoga prima TaxID=1184387 RepID=UPI0025929AEA|nr:ATP-binding protein [uncultured Mesotoga sp.]